MNQFSLGYFAAGIGAGLAVIGAGLGIGKPAFDRIYGKPIFPWLAENPEQAKIFDAAMTGIQTFVLVVVLAGPGTLTIPGYGSIAECEAAVEIIKKRITGRAFCIPGPVEMRQ